MGHVEPLFVIPAGIVFFVLSVWIALAPEQFPRGPRGRVLDRLLGETATNVAMRLGGAVLAGGCLWLVWHSVVDVLGR